MSGDFSANNINKAGLNGCVYNFPGDYRAFGSSDIIDIQKYLMKIMFRLIKKIFMYWIIN